MLLPPVFCFFQEVKTLEGSLADYNLAVDKARTTADPGEVTKYLHDLEDQNRLDKADQGQG